VNEQSKSNQPCNHNTESGHHVCKSCCHKTINQNIFLTQPQLVLNQPACECSKTGKNKPCQNHGSVEDKKAEQPEDQNFIEQMVALFSL